MVNPISSHGGFKVQKSVAPASLRTARLGKHKARLILGTDPRFHMAVKMVHSGDLVSYLIAKIGQLLGYYAELKGHDFSVFININSAANRLDLKKSDIQEAEKQGTLETLLRSTVSGYEESGYEKIVKHLPEADTGKTLMEIIHKVRSSVTIPIYIPLEIKGHTYQIGFDQNKKQIELVIFGKTLGEGSFGEVREFINLLDNTTEAFKQARLDRVDAAKTDVENEYKQLSTLHSQGQLWGIQAKPRRMVKIKENHWTTQFGYLGARYDANYLVYLQKTPQLPLEDHLFNIHQILFGAKALADRNILHGDHKPENILVKQDSDGTTLVHLADLGGACIATPSIPLVNLTGLARTLTSIYSPSEDLQFARAFALNKQYDNLVLVEKQRDVYSLGVVIHEALDTHPPYAMKLIGANNFPDFTKYQSIQRQDVPQELKDLFKSMVDPNYLKRPTAQEGFETYDKFIQNHYPALHHKIQAKMQKEYPGSFPPFKRS